MSPEEVLERHRPLATMLAGKFRGQGWGFDDLVQEAMTALWLESLDHPGDDMDKLASYVMKRRLMKVLEKGRGYGAEPQPGEGRRYEPRDVFHPDGLPAGRGDHLDWKIYGQSPSAEHHVVSTMSRADLWARVDELPDVQRVIAQDKLTGERTVVTAQKVGRTPAGVRKIWGTKILPQLREFV